MGGSHRDEQEDQQDELVYSDSEGEEEGEEVAVATTEGNLYCCVGEGCLLM